MMNDSIDNVLIAESDNEKRRAIVGDEKASGIGYSLLEIIKEENLV